MSFVAKIFKPKRKESLLELICIVMSCWLLSVGTALILDSQFTIQIGIKAILWQTLAATVAVFLLSRRWWIPIIYFGILIPLFFLSVSLSGDLISFFKSIAGFFGWWFGGMSIESQWYSDKGYYLIHTCMNIGVSVMYIAISRITKRAWICVIVALAFVVSNYAFGYTGYHNLTIPFFVVGIFPLIAGEKFQNVKIPDLKNIFGIYGRKWLMVTVSTFVAVLVTATSLFIISNTTGSVRTRFCSDIVSDFQTATDTFTNEQKKVNITLFDLGLAMNSTYIGGNLYDISEEVIATTNLKKPTRIKVTTFGTFNGQNWISGFEKGYRINSIFWTEEQKSYLSTRLLENKEFMEDIEKIASRKNTTFTLKKQANFLPIVGQILDFEEKTRTPNPIFFDGCGRMISYYGQEKGYKYTVESLHYNTTASSTEAKINAILDDYSYIEDPAYDKNSEFYKYYTKPLYEKLPAKASIALGNLKSKYNNQYEIANKINNYFSKNDFNYVKKTDTFNKGDNVVEKLFETKNGHCMYYATAMVALAREAGIPSRLVAGYVTVPNKSRKKQNIDVSSPYAWVECYIPNIGWMEFDPSPNNAQSVVSRPQDLGQEGDIPDYEVEVEKEEEKQVGGTDLKWSTAFTKKLPYIIGGALIFILLSYSVLRTVFSQSFYKLERVRKRFKSTERQAKYYYSDILRQFGCLKFKVKYNQTLREVTQDVFKALRPRSVNELKIAITTIEALYYGNKIPTDADIKQIALARSLLEKEIKYKTNMFVYTVKRRLFLPIVVFKTPKLKK